jgi:tungstate transport system ATP-binding protein
LEENKVLNISLQLEKLEKTYRDVKALKAVSLSLQGNKIIVLLGVNGAGKSTLMRVIAGLENPDTGQILINNQKMSSKVLREISTLVFQKTAMFTMNVCDNLAYGLRIRKIPKEMISERITENLGAVKLVGFEKRRAKKLSGGEQQRVSLARAFMLNPDILLLDEPTANLDPNSSIIIENAIISKKRADRIIVMATHNLSQARRMADEIVHIHDGQIVEAAETVAFFENPKSEISRKFVNGELEF